MKFDLAIAAQLHVHLGNLPNKFGLAIPRFPATAVLDRQNFSMTDWQRIRGW
jgi:hypothetical protein